MENKTIIIHVGFHKSGSTFIQNYFENHKEVFFSREILLDFVNNCNTQILPFEEAIEKKLIFLSDMRLTVNSWGVNELERINSNVFSKETIQNKQREIAQQLKMRFPCAKILITVRDKEQLIPSLYSQYLLNGGFKSFKHFKRDTSFIDTSFDYLYINNLYSSVFGSSNVYQVSYDRLQENPEKFIQTICSIINLPFQQMDFIKINPSLSRNEQNKRRNINKCFYFILYFVPKSKRNAYFKRYIDRLVFNKK